MRKTVSVLAGLAVLIASSANAGGLAGFLGAHSDIDAAPTGAAVEAAYSPDEGAEQLVLKALGASRRSIRLAAYSFTLPSVVEALISAKRRGVDVVVVVDYRNNIEEDRSGKARAALSAVVNAGIPLRTVRRWPIHHDKFAVIDGETVQSGSLNYSAAAAHRNSENVLVVWHSELLAKSFLRHWQRNWDAGETFSTRY